MRPIYLTSDGSGPTYNFAPIIPDIMLTPGNANWVVKLKSGGSGASAVVSLYFSNDDPWDPTYTTNYSTNGTWVQEQAAFQTGASTVGPTATLSDTSATTRVAVGAYSFMPRGLQFRLTSCVSNPVVVVEFVQASGGNG